MASYRLYGHVVGHPETLLDQEGLPHLTIQVAVDSMTLDEEGHLRPKRKLLDVALEGPLEASFPDGEPEEGQLIGLDLSNYG